MIRPCGEGDSSIPRNRFRAGLRLPALIACSPRLAGFVAPNAYGHVSIDYANPDAVKALNQALLKSAYGIDTLGCPARLSVPADPGSERLPALSGGPARSPRAVREGAPRSGDGARHRHRRQLHLPADRRERVWLALRRLGDRSSGAAVGEEAGRRQSRRGRPDRLPASALAARVLQRVSCVRARRSTCRCAIRPSMRRPKPRPQGTGASVATWGTRTRRRQVELRWHGRRAVVRGRGTGVRAAHDRPERRAARAVPMVHHAGLEERAPAASLRSRCATWARPR